LKDESEEKQMPYLNEITVMGHAGRDNELTYSQAGKEISKFSVAVSRGKDKPTDWFNCVSFGQTALIASENVHKGDLVMVKGTMQSNKHEDKTYWSLLVNRIYTFGKTGDKPASQQTSAEDQWESLGREVRLEDIDMVD